ncbi:MAG: TonB terminal [Verrucomicrobiota bacterium]
MNRFQKKCFITSAGFHLLLAAILLIGPAFLSSKSKPVDVQLLDIVPSNLVDAASGGGSPKANPPPPTPPAPKVVESTPVPQPEKIRQADPPKVTVKATESLEVSQDHKRKIQVNLTPVKRIQNPKPADKQTEVDPSIKQLADRRKQLANQLKHVADNVRENTSPTTTIEEEYGPGGGGPAYANYGAWVKTKYDNAWLAPDDATSDDAVAKVSVTIARDGTVVSAHITKASGDSQVDRSVQATLDRVTFIAPFPDAAKEKQRTYIINFNLKAKRGLA